MTDADEIELRDPVPGGCTHCASTQELTVSRPTYSRVITHEPDCTGIQGEP